jgi:hypothetical protein
MAQVLPIPLISKSVNNAAEGLDYHRNRAIVIHLPYASCHDLKLSIMKSLITGAYGSVGSAVVRCLLAAGPEVRAFVRPGSDLRNLAQLPIETEGDMRDATPIKSVQ